MPIRRLSKKDKEQILALDKIIFTSVDPEGGWRESDFNQFFNEEGCYVYYDVENPNELIGYLFATQKEDHTYISNLGSDPRTGKRGIGTALMQQIMLQEAENSKKQNRPFAIKLHVDTNNANAIRFYKNLGFKETGQDQHGIKMTATELPEKFKRMEAQSSKSLRKALIIRNIEGIEYDDLRIALEGLEINDEAPQEFNELIKLIHSKKFLKPDELNKAIDLFKRVKVREYIYETVKAKTGNHIIYHLNGLEDHGRTNSRHLQFILDKLEKIPPKTKFDMLYLGGGHGDPFIGSSNLSKQQLTSITDTLGTKNIKFSAVILGSCFSASYLNLYQPLLKEQGVTISNSLECGGDNNFKPAMQWLKGQHNEFYSNEYLHSSIHVTREIRSAMRRILKGKVPQGEELREKYNQLLDTYRKAIEIEVPGLSNNEIYNLGGDQFNKDLERFIADLQFEIVPPNNTKIQEILEKYPRLNNHIKIVTAKKGEKEVFDALRNCLIPTPTSLVLGTSKTVTLFNFSQSLVMPLYADGEFKENYQAVRDKLKQSGQFSQIIEVLRDFNDLSTKRQFNDLFTQAIRLIEQERIVEAKGVRKNPTEELKKQSKEQQQNITKKNKIEEQEQKLSKHVPTDSKKEEHDDIDRQTISAIEAVEHGVPQATEGYVARFVNAIISLWEGIKNKAIYIAQVLGIVSTP